MGNKCFLFLILQGLLANCQIRHDSISVVVQRKLQGTPISTAQQNGRNSKMEDRSGMDKAKRDLLLKFHNDYRLRMANGKLEGLYRRPVTNAANMFKLEYSQQLERAAQNLADKCKYEHESHATNPYGENIAWDPRRNFTAIFNAWTEDEIKTAKWINYDKFDSQVLRKFKIGHFLQVIWAETLKVGCGYRICKWDLGADTNDAGYLVCRYDPPGNIVGKRIVRRGRACSKCELYEGTCSRGKYQGLCEKSSANPPVTSTQIPSSNTNKKKSTSRQKIKYVRLNRVGNSRSNIMRGFPDRQATGDKLEDKSGMDEEKRNLFLSLHNNFRLKMAKGQVTGRSGRKQPQVGNMFKLEYDLKVEKSAQRWADRCRFAHEKSGYGENIVWDPFRNFTAMFESWTTKEINKVNSMNYDRFDWRTAKRLNVGHFTQIVWGTTKRIGCGYKLCRKNGWDNGFLICRYDPPGNHMNRPMFEKGKPCTKCEEYGGKCENGQYKGMCKAIDTTFTPTSSLSIDNYKDTNGMDDNTRSYILKLHNDYRLKMALGKVKNKYGRNQPQASNMFKLKYDMLIEKSSQQWANRCKFGHDSSNEYGENLAWDSQKDLATMFYMLTDDEIKSVSSVNYDRFDWPTVKRQKIAHFTQIIWAETRRIGCGYKICKQQRWNFGYLVCRYDPPGNRFQVPIFEKGIPCSKCQEYGAKCSQDKGLCQ